MVLSAFHEWARCALWPKGNSLSWNSMPASSARKSATRPEISARRLVRTTSLSWLFLRRISSAYSSGLSGIFASRWHRLPAARMPLEEKAVPPPGLSVFSRSRTCAPFLAATRAAIMPHPPAPMTMISVTIESKCCTGPPNKGCLLMYEKC